MKLTIDTSTKDRTHVATIALDWDANVDVVARALADLMVAAGFHPDNVRDAWYCWVRERTGETITKKWDPDDGDPMTPDHLRGNT